MENQGSGQDDRKPRGAVTPAYLQLCEHAESLGKPELLSSLRRFCALVNARPDLIFFGHVAESAERIALDALDAFGNQSELLAWPELFQWVLTDPAVPLIIGAKFRLVKATKDNRNPFLNQAVSTHPLYSFLVDSHPVAEYRRSFRLLQAQVLLAQSKFAGDDNAVVLEYESRVRDGKTRQADVRGSRSPYAATLLVRSLAKRERAKDLLRLEPDRPVRVFLEEPVPDDTMAKEFRPLTLFVTGSPFSKRFTTRSNGERGRTDWVNGYFDYSPALVGIAETEPESEVGFVEYEVLLNREPEFLDDDEEGSGLSLALGEECPDEDAAGSYCVRQDAWDEPDQATRSETDTGREPGRSQSLRARLWQVELDRSRLPWTESHLRTAELRALLIPHLLSVPPRVEGEHAIAERVALIEQQALLAVCLETSRSVEQAQELFLGGRSGFCCDLDGKGRHWSWPAAGPEYKTELPQHAEYEAGRVERIEQPMSRETASLLKQLCDVRQVRRGRIFTVPVGLVDSLRQRLRQWDPTGRLSAGRISSWCKQTIAREAGWDFLTAGLVLGQRHPGERTQGFYCSLPVERTRALFRSAVGQVFHFEGKRQPELPIEVVTGCRAIPTLATLKSAVARARGDSERLRRIRLTPPFPRDLPSIVNGAVLYLLWHQQFATGLRPTHGCYLSHAEVHAQSSTAFVNDKGDASNHKLRLLFFPEPLLEHMKLVEEILKDLGDAMPARQEASLYFLSSSREYIPVTCSSIEDQMGEWFPFPANTPRKLIRNLLHECGLSKEFVDVFMGHFAAGKQPWGRWSSLNYPLYRSRLEAYVPKCLHALGFEGYA